MKKLIAAAGISAALTTATLAVAPTASAGDAFLMCPSGMSGIATMVTSCPFADNVSRAFFRSPNNVVAYSPVTGQFYAMACAPGYVASFVGGYSRVVAKCFGGNDAEVVVW